MPPPKNSTRTRTLVEGLSVFIFASAFGLLATVGIAKLAETQGWFCVHSWAMMHGSGAVVLLLCSLAGFHLVRTVGAASKLLSPSPQFGWLAHAAYVGGALGTSIFTEKLVWVGLAAGVAVAVQRIRGHAVQPLGIAFVGLIVSLLAAAYWLYLEARYFFLPPVGS